MSFDYSKIPKGHYDQVLAGTPGMRKFWHYHKFESVLRYVPEHLKGEGKSILDVGCFAGSFLGMIPKELFSYQLGVDILPTQIDYANERYGTSYREFQYYPGKLDLSSTHGRQFDVITLIEVIEHLDKSQIYNLLSQIKMLLKKDGCLIITTPNYASTWPLLEFLLNHFSDIDYEEQHQTKFNYFCFEQKMKRLLQDVGLKCDAKTTTHFLSPFIAPLSYEMALNMATKIPSAHWKNPFGNIILSRWKLS